MGHPSFVGGAFTLRERWRGQNLGHPSFGMRSVESVVVLRTTTNKKNLGDPSFVGLHCTLHGVLRAVKAHKTWVTQVITALMGTARQGTAR